MEKDFFDEIVVVKRSGQRVNFNDAKVAIAVKKGFDSVYEEYDEKQVNKVKEKVLSYIKKNYKDRKTINVEDVQDAIEKVLQDMKYDDVYTSFKEYRERRAASREAFVVKQQHKFVKAIESLGLKTSSEENAKRENANVDGDGPMGTMLHFGSTVSREFAKAYLMDNKYARAHDEGLIHIHDLDFWAMGTTTCTQIDLHKLFKNGFSTGHGYLRTPNSIGSYSALAAIAIQANQNEQHGGQSIPAFDYYMAPGVLKTFKKEFKQALYNLIDFEGFSEFVNFNKVIEIIDKLESIEFNMALFDEFTLKSKKLKEIFDKAYDEAIAKTDRSTYQAMEAFIHNLNTMHSRAGAQVPFSSVNFGTDTSPEGRMVIKNYLLATDAGLGHGETPIFPISIFKVKEGINYNKEDPSYDLFRLACRVSAKRLFPNFSFLDASFNKKFLVEGDYNTEVGYMGCRTRVLANVCGPAVTPGRGNLSFTSINLPRIGIKHGICLGERDKADMKGFYEELDETIELVKGQLLQRFECQCSKTRANFKFLLGSGVWINSEKMDYKTKLRTVLKHGTLSIGFIGLAETLKALIGEHHVNRNNRNCEEGFSMRRQALSLLVENNPGVTSRISGLFSRRGFNIDSFSSGVTADPRYTRITIVASGDEQVLEQIEKQLAKLEDVLDIKKLEPGLSVCRELIMIKIRALDTQRQAVMNVTEIFHGKIVDVTHDSMIIELIGTQDKLDKFIDLLSGYEILELARTGITGLTRGSDDVVMLD